MASLLSPALSVPFFAFDMDGTLIDTNDNLNNTGRFYLSRRGIDPALHEDFFTAALTMDDYMFSEGLQKITGEYGKIPVEKTKEEIVDGVWEVYRNLTETKPFVREYLEKLQKENKTMIVCSTTRLDCIEYTMDKLGLSSYFAGIYSADYEGTNKKDPGMFETVAKRFGFEPGDMVMVDDSPTAIGSAARAGCRTMAVGDPVNEFNPKYFPTADLFVRSFEELL